ncbi:MAG: hypothetical protein K8I29_12615 [Alphaproteobacteria bacterium]|uniref:FMN-binding protein n=1 Tax=Candidatus Nitrobium versatile TaxID=2884831 RepID=A0A953M0M8_9BACT|nr:hypothetical protein [Candidatus Nitrobium versatile]
MKEAILAGVVPFLLLLSPGALAHDLVWPGEKLKAMFPQAESFEQKNLYISDEQRARIEKMAGVPLPEEDLKPSLYLAVVRSAPGAPPRKAAAMLFIDAQGEGGKIEMGVVVNGKGELERIHLFENRESEKVTRSSFLKQFEGKKTSDPFKTGVDITAPAGQEKATQAIASGAKRGLLIINELFKRK